MVRPNKTPNEQQIHSCKNVNMYFSPPFCFFLNAIYVKYPEVGSVFFISHRNNTFCFWDQLVGGWPLFFSFSLSYTSIRHAGPGPEPTPGWEAQPRHWHAGRPIDPLAGVECCHRLWVQDTGGTEGHIEGEKGDQRLELTEIFRLLFCARIWGGGGGNKEARQDSVKPGEWK